MQVDWSRVASQAGYKNAAVAQKRYEQIRKKFRELAPESTSIVSPSRSHQKSNGTPVKSGSTDDPENEPAMRQKPTEKKIKVEKDKKRKRGVTPNSESDISFSELYMFEDET